MAETGESTEFSPKVEITQDGIDKALGVYDKYLTECFNWEKMQKGLVPNNQNLSPREMTDRRLKYQSIANAVEETLNAIGLEGQVAAIQLNHDAKFDSLVEESGEKPVV